MKKLIKTTISIMMLLQLLSCTGGTPYEIRSPCVAIESDNPFAVNPCVRRPANTLHDIG